jgi:hypothetical protein
VFTRIPITATPGARSRSRPSRKAGDIAAGTIETGDETSLDGVGAHTKDDRDCGGCLARDNGRHVTADANENSRFTRNKIGGERGQPVVIALRPAGLDHNVLPFDEPGIGEPLPKCGD